MQNRRKKGWCKLCHSTYNSELFKSNPRKKDLQRNYRLKNKFGISLNDYEFLCAVQNNKCDICDKEECNITAPNGTKNRLSVDHNHITGKIRGLLCHKCNTAIGSLNCDSGIELLNKALEYLK